MHLDDESCVAASGSKIVGHTGNNEVAMLKKEIEELKQLVVRNENVDQMSGLELVNYENTLKQQLKDLAREITKVYKSKNERRVLLFD